MFKESLIKTIRAESIVAPAVESKEKPVWTVIGDIHFSFHPRPFFQGPLDDWLKYWGTLFDVIKEDSPYFDISSPERMKQLSSDASVFVCVGDITHSKPNRLPVKTAKELELLSNIFPMHIVPGNHDLHSGGMGAFNSTYIKDIGNYNFPHIPYAPPSVCETKEDYLKYILLYTQNGVDRSSQAIVFAHNAFTFSTIPDKVFSEVLIPIAWVRELFPNMKTIISGHIHSPSYIATKGGIRYFNVGSVVPTNISQAGDVFHLPSVDENGYITSLKELPIMPCKVGDELDNTPLINVQSQITDITNIYTYMKSVLSAEQYVYLEKVCNENEKGKDKGKESNE